MNNPTPEVTNTKFIELLKTYWAWRRLWVATTVLFGGLGLLYVLFLKNDTWVASQGLIVRDEANGAVMRLGRFQSQTEMKAAQETILEMARNTQVLREALLEVGPAKSLFSFNKITEAWPSQREVADLADESIGVRAPQGAEFGTTEVIYLDIKQHSRERALALNKAVCQALDSRLRQVRVARADGVINELVRASSMATEDLKKAAEQLQLIEREAGADLADLRGLSEANGSGSASRNQLEVVKNELRQVETQHASLQSDLALLNETQADPERILSAPASILSAHPGLRKLREGLADAQLSTSQLRGRFTSSHPLVFVATSAESEIKQQLQNELALATTNAQREVNISQARIDKLKRQQQQLEERLERLARIRTEHEQLNQEVRSRTKILQDAEKQLADTRAARDAALTTSLLTRIDDPVLGEKPVGPGRSTILAAMTMAGLCFGLGIVFLLTPLDGTTPNNNRWNEQLGRRLSDRFPWLADQGPNGAPRRRRSDVDRRGNDRGNDRGASARATNEGAAGRGRRQSDQILSGSSSPAPAIPEIKQEDPSVATRLENMLNSELAAMAPVPREAVSASVAQPIEMEQATAQLNSVEVISGIDALLASSDAQLTTMESIVATLPAYDSSSSIRSSIDSLDASTNDSVNDAADVRRPTDIKLTPAVSAVIPSALRPAQPVEKEVTRPRLRSRELTPSKPAKAVPPQRELPREPAPKPTSQAREVSAQLPESAAPRPVAPRPVAPQAQAPQAQAPQAQAPQAQVSRPSASTAPQPLASAQSVPAVQTVQPAARPVQPPTAQVNTREPKAEPGSNQNKPSTNMFRPNQALETAEKPRTGFVPPIAPAKPKPIVPSNGFETPAEGGLAGIGLPTQKLPDSFEYRQGLR